MTPGQVAGSFVHTKFEFFCSHASSDALPTSRAGLTYRLYRLKPRASRSKWGLQHTVVAYA